MTLKHYIFACGSLRFNLPYLIILLNNINPSALLRPHCIPIATSFFFTLSTERGCGYSLKFYVDEDAYSQPEYAVVCIMFPDDKLMRDKKKTSKNPAVIGEVDNLL
jgi:hypothetical protein